MLNKGNNQQLKSSYRQRNIKTKINNLKHTTMKNLIISLSLIIAFTTTALAVEYEPIALNDSTLLKEANSMPNIEEVAFEEGDAPFDFDTAAYLPKGFDAYKGMFEEIDIVEEDEPFEFDTAAYLPVGFNAFEGLYTDYGSFEEEDEAFDFNTKDYLPAGFDAFEGLYTEYGAVEELDEAFEFDTKDYLPVGFNANLNLDAIVEIAIEEADEPFDFDTSKYLKNTFDAYAGLNKTEHTFLNCMSFPSL